MSSIRVLADSSLQGLCSRHCSAVRGLSPLLRGAQSMLELPSAVLCWHVMDSAWSTMKLQRRCRTGSLSLLCFHCSAGRRARQPAAQQVCLDPGHPLHCSGGPGHLAGAAAVLEDGPHRAEGCCATGEFCSLWASRWLGFSSQGCHAMVLACISTASKWKT